MFCLPWHSTLPTRRKQRNAKVLHPMAPIRFLPIQFSPLIPLRHISHQFRHHEPGIPDIVVTQLSQSNTVSWTLKALSYARPWKRSFSSQAGFREWRITRLRKTFFAEGDDYAGVHVPACEV